MRVWIAVTSDTNHGTEAYLGATEAELEQAVVQSELHDGAIDRLPAEDAKAVRKLLKAKRFGKAIETFFRAAADAETGVYLDCFEEREVG